ncbi:MAG: cytochrome P450 [Candidatus Binataceae bacterium]
MDTTGDFYFNPWDPQFRANPYPHYQPLLSGPPHKLEMFFPIALVARYADTVAVLRDHQHFSSVQPPPPPGLFEESDPFVGGRTMLFSDPPEHTRLRRLVSRDFTPKRIRELEPRVRQIAAALLDKVAAKTEFEVMADLANALPVMVIAEMLGVPPEQYETFKHWSDTIVSGDNTLPGTPLPAEFHQARRDLATYFSEEIERRRRRPGADLVSALVAHNQADALDGKDLLAFVVLLLLAGNETTTNLIGNGMLALAKNPDQLERLRKEPALMPRAVEEMLRYDGPVQSTVRHPRAAVEIGGTTVEPGTAVFVLLAAADRDPAQFPKPDRFDIARDPNEHVAFGEGIHFCIGAPLARLEGAIAIGSVLERFARLRLADPEAPLTYKGSFFLRGLSSLPMAID